MRRIAQKIWHQKIQKIEKKSILNNDGITNQVAFGKPGIYRYDVLFQDDSMQTFVAKRKSKKIIVNGIRLLSRHNLRIGLLLIKNHTVFGFNKSYIRETFLYKNLDVSLKNYLIPVYGEYQNRLTDNYILMLKYISSSRKVTAADYKTVFDAITDFHKMYYGKSEFAAKCRLNHYSAKNYSDCKAVLLAMFDELESSNRSAFSPVQIHKITRFLQNIDKEYLSFHKTLTHNDFSPRNIFCVGNKLYIYDWELACYQNPEHDLIEFLVSVIHEVEDEQIYEMIRYFKKILLKKLGIEMESQQYAQILRFNALEYAVNRLSLLRLVNKTFKQSMIDQMTMNMSRLMDIFEI